MNDKFNLILKDENSAIIDKCFCNLKSVNKSIENNELWILDEHTDRVLPYRQNLKLVTIDKIDNYTYCALVITNVTNRLSTDKKMT